MSNKITNTIEAHFSELEDPRTSHLNDHPLINILTITLCAVIAGAESWTDVENFGHQKKPGWHCVNHSRHGRIHDCIMATKSQLRVPGKSAKNTKTAKDYQ